MLTAGMKSSEFLLSLIPVAVGLVLVYLGLKWTQPTLIESGMVLMGVGSGGFAISRGLTKFGTALPTGPKPDPAPTSDTDAAKLLGKIP